MVVDSTACFAKAYAAMSFRPLLHFLICCACLFPQPRHGQAIAQEEQVGIESAQEDIIGVLMDQVLASSEPLPGRRVALESLERLAADAPERLEPLLEVLLDDRDELELRRTILLRFGDAFVRLEAGREALIALLDHPSDDSVLRRQSGLLLRTASAPSANVLETFGRLVRRAQEDSTLKALAMGALVSAAGTAEARAIVEDLLLDGNLPVAVRLQLLAAIQGLGSGSAAFKDPLIRLAADPDQPGELRSGAISVLRGASLDAANLQSLLARLAVESDAAVQEGLLGLLGPLNADSQGTADQLRQLLEPGHSAAVRHFAFSKLLQSEAYGPALSELKSLALDSTAPMTVRESALELVIENGSAQEEVEFLLSILHDASLSERAREMAGRRIISMARADFGPPEQLSRRELNVRIDELIEFREKLRGSAEAHAAPRAATEAVNNLIELLVAERESRWIDRGLNWAEARNLHENRWLWAGLIGISVLIVALLFWRILLAISPGALWRANQTLGRFDSTAPGFLGAGGWRLRHITLASLWSRDPKVTDAWMASWSERLRQNHSALNEDFESWVTVPARIGDHLIESDDAQEIRRLFSWSRRVIVTGPKGSGKTALAKRMARMGMAEDPSSRLHADLMAPVWIGGESWRQQLITHPKQFLALVARKLGEAIGAPEHGRPETVLALVRGGRLLLALDDLTDCDPRTRTQALEWVEKHQAAVILVYEREGEAQDDARLGRISPSLLDGIWTVRFVERYLAAAGHRDLFSDSEVFEACRDLAMMTGGRPLLIEQVKLYAGFLVGEKRGGASGVRPPTLPGVMEALALQLNRRVAGKRLADNVVSQAARAFAWECVRTTFSAQPARLIDVYPRFQQQEEFSRKLDYLERKIGVIRPTPADSERYEFVHGTQAEALAALKVVDDCGGAAERWRALFQEADEKPNATGLLLAIADICVNAEHVEEVDGAPRLAHDELEKRLGADLVGARPGRLQIRAEYLLRRLLTPEMGDKGAMIEELIAMGGEAPGVVSHLVRAAKDKQEDLEGRQSALEVLARLEGAGEATASVLDIAMDKEDHLFFRLKALDLAAASRAKEFVRAAVMLAADRDEARLLRLKCLELLEAAGRAVQSESDRLKQLAARPDELEEIRARAQALLRPAQGQPA